jgi:hypothetical protein
MTTLTVAFDSEECIVGLSFWVTFGVRLIRMLCSQFRL